ncbi:DUF397 domain-containing protein [Amycolatopsis sp. cmx-4-68]|uniref:DUF397 domain-containing protein n=1 Tax=Amycolatopsis sp. cmx-4-68 TaxID=2790938 RepID=UPI00397B377B
MTEKSQATSAPRRDGWFKSSYSNAGGSCVETLLSSGAALVRDSKDRRADQPVIELSPAAWTSFLRVVTPEDPLMTDL